MPNDDENGKSWRRRVYALGDIGPLLKMVWEISPWLVLFSITARVLKSLLPVATLYIGKLIIDAVVHSNTYSAGIHRVAKLIVIELGLAVLSDLLGRATVLVDSLVGDLFTNRMSVDLMRHAATLDLIHFEDSVFYDRLERARRQTGNRMQLISQVFGTMQDAITLITLTSALIVFSPWMFFLLCCAVIPEFLGETHFAGLNYDLLYARAPQRRELDYLRWLGATLESAKEIKVFGLGTYLSNRYDRLARDYYVENRALEIKRAYVGFLLALIGTGGYYGAYAVLVFRSIQGVITVGGLTFLAGSFSRSRSLIESILLSFSNISDQALYLEDLFGFFRLQPSIVSKPSALHPPKTMRVGIEFRNVSFRYPGSDRDALSNLNFTLRPGQRLALLGENGAGKTTITKLLARLYDPTEGQILIDGIDLREYSLEEWRREVGIIFQDYMRYHFLFRENIGVGRVELIEDQARIQKAARQSLAVDVAQRLERGFDQMLGRRFVNGVDLSGGEWQKVALARAYMRDAQVLILDEPTASLDARAEHEVFQRFAALTQNKMAVLISHRFSTVRMADWILVICNGCLVEEGTHADLVNFGGRYAELFELQASGYR